MKKFAALLLALVMALSLAACGNQNTPATSGSASGSTSGEETNVYNVVYLVNGNLGDKSFFDSAEAGLAQLKADGRITYQTIEMGALDEDQPKWLSTLYEVSESGEYDVIICGTYQMPEYLQEVATKYPEQKYVIFDDTTHVGENANVVNISYKQNDMGYLIGVFAASMTSQVPPL